MLDIKLAGLKSFIREQDMARHVRFHSERMETTRGWASYCDVLFPLWKIVLPHSRDCTWRIVWPDSHRSINRQTIILSKYFHPEDNYRMRLFASKELLEFALHRLIINENIIYER